MELGFEQKKLINSIIKQEKIYEAQQLYKIESSNRKLSLLERKMRSLLQKDNRQTSDNASPQKLFVNCEPNTDQLKKYFQSSRNDQANFQSPNELEDDDLLLDHESKKDPNHKKIPVHFSVNQANYSYRPANTELKSKRQKSSSLKIFKNSSKNNRNQIKNNQVYIENQTNYIQKKGKGLSNTRSFGQNEECKKQKENEKNKKQEKLRVSELMQLRYNEKQSQSQDKRVHKSSKSEIQSWIKFPISDQMRKEGAEVASISQLEQMMQKSISIKQKQLILAKEQLQRTQNDKIEQYRRSTELQMELENIRKYGKEIRLSAKLIQPQKSDTKKVVFFYQKMLNEEESFISAHQSLLQQLKQLQYQQYTLQLFQKKNNFQLRSLQTQFHSLLKSKFIQNKENNCFDNIVHKKIGQARSISNQRIKNNKVAKSTSSSGINRNRCAFTGCQSQDRNFQTDKILFSMVHELSKLKQIVSKQIEKTKVKIDLKTQNNLQDQYNKSNNKTKSLAYLR